MLLELKEFDKNKVGFFRFKRLADQYLLTNDLGDYYFLDPNHFQSFIRGDLEKILSKDKFDELRVKGFLRDKLDFENLINRYSLRNSFLGQGPSLHILVITLRCDHNCLYCQAGAKHSLSKQLDMDENIAKAVVERIFDSPSKNIIIEFQGGEPLLNFKTLKFVVEYARQKNKKANKTLHFTVVSNLTFMSDSILDYLVKNNIHLCTSLDGPEKIHNKCRKALNKKNTYKNTVKWLQKIKKSTRVINSFALTTVTRFSLNYPKDIVDEYVKLGLRGIHLRPVSPFGVSEEVWRQISYSAEEFISFYKKALDYIINLNSKGTDFNERYATVFLTKMLTNTDPNYLDVRSPCGAAIGQVAYNFDGGIYTCDEGRMFSRRGDETFRLGDVRQGSYKEMMDNHVTKTVCLASCLDSLPGCSECVYKTYCGVCPIYNYATTGNIFNKNQFLCKINTAIMDDLFIRLKDEPTKRIFYKWVSRQN